MRRVLKYLKPYRKECIIGPIFKFLEVVFELLLPTIMAMIINYGIANRDKPYVLKMGTLMAVMAILGYLSAIVCQVLASVASQGYGTELRNRVFSHIMSLSVSDADDFGASTLTTRLTNDINQLQVFVAMTIRLATRAPFICIGAVIMAFILNRRLALILAASIPVFALVIYVITKLSAPLYKAYQGKLDELSGTIRENIAGVRVIRAFSRNDAEREHFGRVNTDIMETGFKIGRISAVFNPLTSFILNAVVIIILWNGSVQINLGSLSNGEIIAFINYTSQILSSLLVLSNLIILTTKAFASAGRLQEVLETESEDKGPQTMPQLDMNAPAVAFYDVSFSHNKSGELSLNNISMEAKRGETIGIIGATGSGKSTFINMIGRFYPASQGEIGIFGVPIDSLPVSALRDMIGYAPQKALLFSGTVAENIRLSKPHATDEEVIQAAIDAQADGFIKEMPQGYNSRISRGGKNLSGGQRQRISVARAIINNPDILILDDATSALDFLTDSRLRQAIKRRRPDQTVFIVSQRVGVIKNSDRILVFDDGHIVGNGTHDELMNTCELYRDIYRSQLSKEESA